LANYLLIFQDWLAMRALVTNEVKSLDDEHTLDMFPTGCTYGPFFQNCSREERKAGSTTAHKYKADSILSTLLGFEKYPDFPGRKSTNAPPKLALTTRTILPRFSTRFNSMPSTLVVMTLFQTLVPKTIRLLTRQLSLSIQLPVISALMMSASLTKLIPRQTTSHPVEKLC
jgi:hypothetical protein